jgi:hypothetical protein
MMLGPMMAAAIYSLWPAYVPIMYNAVIMSLIGYVIFFAASRREVANEIAAENLI